MTAHNFDAAAHPCKGRSACAIRPSQADDATRLAVLATQVWLHTYATEGISNEIADYVLAELTPAKFSVALGDTSSRILVAEQGSNLTGFAALRLNAACPVAGGPLAELQTLYVQAPFIGTGLGKRLLKDAEAVAQQQGHTALWLTVNAQNHRAIAFYDHLGYRKIGTAYFVLGAQRHENHVMLGPTARQTTQRRSRPDLSAARDVLKRF